MNPNQKETWQRFANISHEKGIIEIIESKSLLNQIKIVDDARLPLAHEKILFSTISPSSEITPEMKLLSMLENFESKLEKKDAMKENKKFQGTLEL